MQRWMVIVGFILMLGSLTGFTEWTKQVQRMQDPVQVLKVTRDVPQGATILQADLKPQEVPGASVPKAAVGISPGAMTGKQASVPLRAGQWLVRGDVGGPLAAPPGYVQVSVQVSLSSFGGAKPGDWVEVGAVEPGSGGRPGMSAWLFSHHPVRVLQILSGSGAPVDQGQPAGGGLMPGNTTPATAILAVTSAQAAALLPYDTPNSTMLLGVVGKP